MNKFIQKIFIVSALFFFSSIKSNATKITIGLDPLAGYFIGADSVVSLTISNGDTLEWFYYGLGNPSDFWQIFDTPLGSSQIFSDSNFMGYTVFSTANGYSLGPFFITDLVSYDIGFGLEIKSFGLEVIISGGPLAINNFNLNVNQTNLGNELWWNFNSIVTESLYIQKSQDGILFNTIATVANNVNNYIDKTIDNSTQYYRIAYLQNGKMQYSNIEKLVPKNNDLIAYPNPAENLLHINVNNEFEYINIYHTNGILVKQSHLNNIDISTFGAGVYYGQVVYSNNKIEKFSFIKK